MLISSLSGSNYYGNTSYLYRWNNNMTSAPSGNSASTPPASDAVWLERLMRRIADAMGEEDYLTFGMKLRVPHEMSKHIKESKDGRIGDATVAMLDQWRKKWGATPSQLAQELTRALDEANLQQLARHVEEEIQKNPAAWESSVKNVHQLGQIDLSEIDGSKSNGGSHESQRPGRSPRYGTQSKFKANYLIQPPWKV